jgi:hypothetical protein
MATCETSHRCPRKTLGWSFVHPMTMKEDVVSQTNALILYVQICNHLNLEFCSQPRSIASVQCHRIRPAFFPCLFLDYVLVHFLAWKSGLCPRGLACFGRGRGFGCGTPSIFASQFVGLANQSPALHHTAQSKVLT